MPLQACTLPVVLQVWWRRSVHVCETCQPAWDKRNDYSYRGLHSSLKALWDIIDPCLSELISAGEWAMAYLYDQKPQHCFLLIEDSMHERSIGVITSCVDTSSVFKQCSGGTYAAICNTRWEIIFFSISDRGRLWNIFMIWQLHQASLRRCQSLTLELHYRHDTPSFPSQSSKMQSQCCTVSSI